MSIIKNSNIRVSDMDFDGIKTSLKSFLKNQGEFADYDFEASGMTVLMDILAYNTYYNSVLANYVANETFIDSAVRRDSVVSIAKSLGYRPKSARSAKARIGMTLSSAVGEPDSLVLKAGTPFDTVVKQQSYQFVVLNDVVASHINGTYDFGVFDIWQGTFQSNRFIASGTAAEKFTLPNANVDTSSIVVVVQESASNLNYNYYQPADTISDVTATSLVFYIQEGIGNLTEIYFGDNTLGAQLAAGNVVIVTYITTDGASANGAKVFNLAGTIEGNSLVQVSTYSAAAGGADAETIDSIRFNATTYFGVQNRAVTSNDYKSLIQQNFQNVKNVVTWGGEKSDPPQYGKIFICIQPQNAEFLTTNEIEEIKTLMKLKSVANISPEFVNPVYIDCLVTTEVVYDPVKNNNNSDQLKTLVYNQIMTYANTYLGKFDTTMRYSQLTRLIDQSDPSIMNNLTDVKLYTDFLPVLNQPNDMTFSFNNAIDLHPGASSFYSSGFYVDGISQLVYLRDNRAGLIEVHYYDAGGVSRTIGNVGTINYTTGQISIPSITVTDYHGTAIKLYMIPSRLDAVSKNNTLIRIDADDITIKLTANTGAT
jgi:nitrate reductase NapAB chaperone NapD